MSAWICGTLMMLRIAAAEPENGGYAVLMESRNVPAQECLVAAVVGEASISWQTKVSMKEGNYVWARVWAVCEPMIKYADDKYAYRAWYCNADRVEVQ